MYMDDGVLYADDQETLNTRIEELKEKLSSVGLEIEPTKKPNR